LRDESGETLGGALAVVGSEIRCLVHRGLLFCSG
jgi:hypothetical protein